MWESPAELWRRLKLGREEYLQRLITTWIVGGDPPSWNTPCSPDDRGIGFLRLLDNLAHQEEPERVQKPPGAFIDEYLLPKLDESGRNGCWPDWAAVWTDRICISTEAAIRRIPVGVTRGSESRRRSRAAARTAWTYTTNSPQSPRVPDLRRCVLDDRSGR
jgi:hypothetical protein